MSDFNQSSNQKSLEFEEYPDLKTSILPDFNQVIQTRMQDIKKGGKPVNFDPYKLMVDKKEKNSGEFVDDKPVQTWQEKDLKALEDFCIKHGIIGFNTGRMSPIASLAFLKRKLEISDDVPLEERIPAGYEKIHRFNPNYPYTEMVRRKILIKG